MNEAMVDKILRAVLYEGYMLYPYRPSVKNHHRWTFGTLYPQAHSERLGGSDAWMMQTECLAKGSPRARLRVKLRFLQLVDRRVGELIEPVPLLVPDREPAFRTVDSLLVGQRIHHAWQETVERELATSEMTLGHLSAAAGRQEEAAFEGAREVEPLLDPGGLVVGLLMRERRRLLVEMEVAARLIEPGLFRVTVRIRNRTEARSEGSSRDEALSSALLSTHLVLGIEEGQFTSLIDPPAPWRRAAEECRNIGAFPVLVGADEDADAMLASPIILYDYPQIAPESAGDLFDCCEIDELLAMRIRTMTDQEKHSMAAVDARTQALLERTESLFPEELTRMHGAVRTLRPNARGLSNAEPQGRRLRVVRVDACEVRPGDRVRLRPRSRADAFDMLLDGKVATVAAIEQDFEDRVHLAVTLEDDPGADLGVAGKIGHRFFFFLDEVERLVEGQPDRP